MEIEKFCRSMSAYVQRPKSQRLLTGAASAFLVFNLLVLIGYLFFGYQNTFHTDASTKNLLAQEMLETGRFFPPEWNYANRDLMIVFGQVLILPLLLFFKNGFVLHAVSGLCFSLAILIALWKMTALLSTVKWQRIATIAVIVGGVSLSFSENIFGQVAYGAVLLLAGLLILLTWRTLCSEGHALTLNGLLLLGLVTLATWNNPQRAVISYTLPLAFSVACHLLSSWGGALFRQRMRATAVVYLAIILGTACGALLSWWVILNVQNNNGVASARWLSYDGGFHNLVESFQGLMGMFGGIPDTGAEVVSVAGVYQALRLLCSVALIILVPVVIYHRVRDDSASVRFIVLFTVVQAFGCLFLYVATTIPDMNDPVTSARYLAPSVILGVVILYTAPLRIGRPLQGLFIVSTMLVLISNGVVRPNKEAMPIRARSNDHADIVAGLRSNQLKYGYASYWNSGVYTVLSEGDSKVRQILIIDGLPIPMRHLGSNRWYEAETWKGPSFLLLDKAESEKVNWDVMRTLMGEKERKIPVGNLTAFVYSKNVAAVLPNWSRNFKSPVTYRATPGAMYNQGHWDEGKKAVISMRGEAGFIAYGPYIHLPKGRYRAEFHLRTVDAANGVEVGVVDVVSNSATSRLAIMPIRASADQSRVLDFTLEHSAEIVEIRTYANGVGSLEYKGVTLTPLSSADES
ncbi:hypothetical protein [Xanthomonas campestris]|uniref:hypothetical protein n=1 Tax=Xanthomonas campestris TaxID=339 RepID=UPI000E1EF1A3|nr:hypothetical protein [Xanthomonas campestris]